MELGPVVEPLLLLVATIGGCFVVHEFIVRRTPVLRPLFGLSSNKTVGALLEARPRDA